jgi:hypothetical protein
MLCLVMREIVLVDGDRHIVFPDPDPKVADRRRQAGSAGAAR